VTGRARDTQISRSTVRDTVKTAIWARSAGRCTICNRRLLGNSRSFLHSVTAAELAHNVGATDDKKSPRSKAATLGMDRESEENLLLLCHDCHRIIDDQDHIPFFPPEKLRAIKAAHEKRIEMATAQGGLTRTAVIRVGSNIRSNYSIASQQQVAETLFALNYIGLVESQWSGDFTCNISGHAGGKGYWQGGEQQIDDTLLRVKQAVERHDIEHISVFPFAPIPLLVYLGAHLDDKVTTRIFQKHRGQNSGWAWEPGDPIDFISEIDDTGDAATEVVLVCEVSSSIDPDKIPSNLQRFPRYVLRPVGHTPSPTLITCEQSLTNFALAWRNLLADVEANYPSSTRWHVIASVPISVAVELGRSFMREAQPAVDVYERDGDRYIPVLSVNIVQFHK
jgi:5-methylcytosine-specific restriction endonuclease McrA